MAITTLENGAKIATFDPPPTNFNPLIASADDLARYGFPQRPSDPQLLARFQNHYTRIQGRYHFIQPTFRVDPTKTTHTQPGSKTAGTEKSDNWSGGVVYAPAGQSFSWLQGEWVVPDVYPPTPGKWHYCASWIGLDGDGGSSDVCQAGMICSAYQTGGTIQRNIYPWHEWYPQSWVEITNLAISPGDMISMLICTPSGAGSTSATIFFCNVTSGASTAYTITAPSGTKLAGNSAEWITETPMVNGQLATMPDYGEIFFSICEAHLTNGSVVNGGTGNNVNLERNDKTQSSGTLITPTIIQCKYVTADH
jgi:Peptidase A4 family